MDTQAEGAGGGAAAAAAAAPAKAAGASGLKRKRDAEDVDAAPEEDTRSSLAGDELAGFLGTLDEYTPTIPDSVIAFYLQRSGVNTKDQRILRMVSLATQKFLSEVSQDALQHCKQRQAGTSTTNKKTGKDKHYTLTTQDLNAALQEHGVNAVRPQYYL